MKKNGFIGQIYISFDIKQPIFKLPKLNIKLENRNVRKKV